MEPQAVGDFLIASRAAVRQAGELLVQYSFSIVGALVLLMVGWLAARFLHRWALYGMRRIRGFDVTLAYFLANVVRYAVLILVVVMALGKNWYINRDHIGHTRRMLGKRHVLVIVTPREPGGIYSGDAHRIRAAGRAHPDRIKVLDWVRYSRGQGSWFGPDGIHLTYTGVTNYVRFIRRSLRWAKGSGAAG